MFIRMHSALLPYLHSRLPQQEYISIKTAAAAYSCCTHRGVSTHTIKKAYYTGYTAPQTLSTPAPPNPNIPLRNKIHEHHYPSNPCHALLPL